MSKEKKSKLDPYTERLDGWFGVEKKTIAQVQEELRLDGCVISAGRLSEWWSARQCWLQEQALLQQIASGARATKEIEAELSKHPAPETETLIKLVRVLIMKFSTQANVTPEMSELVFNMLKPVIKWHELQGKNEDREINRKKFQRDTCELFLKWYEDKRAKEIASSGLTYDDKLDALYLAMFGEARRGLDSNAASQPRAEKEPAS